MAATTLSTVTKDNNKSNRRENSNVKSILGENNDDKCVSMVETLGSVVNALVKETATTNDTMKQMMIQQTATMNNFMMIVLRNEERRQEVPIREIQQMSTPASTITNSQFSLSQQSTSANKRKIDGIAVDETTAASTTAIGTDPSIEDDDIDAMLEEQSDAMEEIRTKQKDEMDITVTDNAETTAPPQ
jgi:hypothetical protein